MYPFKMKALPYNEADFGDRLSAESFDFHYGKHHTNYLNKLNDLLRDHKELHGKSLEEITLIAYNKYIAIFNNAAQVLNHDLFWASITPQYIQIEGFIELRNQINKDFDSFEQFCKTFETAALSQFGSGWVWLAYKDGKLHILTTSNANNPICDGYEILLTCDLWEHAYYINYRNDRLKYIKIFLQEIANWKFAQNNLNKIIGNSKT